MVTWPRNNFGILPQYIEEQIMTSKIYSALNFINTKGPKKVSEVNGNRY